MNPVLLREIIPHICILWHHPINIHHRLKVGLPVLIKRLVVVIVTERTTNAISLCL